MYKKEERQKCYDARDAYFKCVEQRFGKDIGPPIPGTTTQPPSVNTSKYDLTNMECNKEHSNYRKICPNSWYEHFIRKLHLNIRNRQLGLPEQ